MLDANELNEILAEELRALRLGSAPTDSDIKRITLKLALSDRLIDCARLTVNLSLGLKGATTVPFVEGADGNGSERPNAGDQASPRSSSDKPLSAMERTAQVLTSGPPDDHPWRRQVTRAPT